MAVTWKKLAYEDDVITKAFIAAKGDIISASGNDTPLILTVGANDKVLVADSSAATGLKWDSPAPASHATSHENGGGDEISVSGLSGLLADDQHVLDTEVTAVIEATPLNDLAAADGDVDFDGQAATHLVIQNVADDAAKAALTAVVGMLAFQVDELAFYGCTVDA